MTINSAKALRPPSNIATWQIRGEAQSASQNSRHHIYIIQAPVMEFTHVRLCIRNVVGAVMMPNLSGGEGFNVAVTESNLNMAHPQIFGDATAKSLTNDPKTGWCTALWNGQKEPIVPYADTTFGASSKRSSYTYSDWLYMPSIPVESAYNRITGQQVPGIKYPFLMVAFWIPTSVPGNWPCLSTSSFPIIGRMANLLDKGCYIEGVDQFKATNSFITNPETYTGSTSGSSGNPLFTEAQFVSTQPVVNVMATGDSVVAGQGSDDGHYIHSFVHRTCRILQGKGYNVASQNMGWGSQTSATYSGFIKDAVSAHRPEILLYSMYTTNDTAPTQTIVDQQFARGMEVADFCKRAGTLPVFVFLAGNNLGYTPENDRLRKNLIARAKKSGIPVWDANPVTTGNGIPALPLPGMLAANGADTVHLSDFGNETVAQAFAPELARLIDENFSEVRTLPIWRS